MWTLISVVLTVMALRWVFAAPAEASDFGSDFPESAQPRWWRSRLALLLVTPLAISGAASVIGAAGNLGLVAWMVGLHDESELSGLFADLIYASPLLLPTLFSAAAVWQFGHYLVPTDSSDEAWPRWVRWLAACALIATTTSTFWFLVQPLFSIAGGDISVGSSIADGAGYLVGLAGFAWALTGSRRLASSLEWIVLPMQAHPASSWVFRIALATAFGQTLLSAISGSHACVAGQVPGLQGFDEAVAAQWCGVLTHLLFAGLVLLTLRPRFLALARAWLPGQRWSAGEQVLAWSAGLYASSTLISMAKGTWLAAMGPLAGPLWRLGVWGADSGRWGLLKQYGPQIVLLLAVIWLLRWRPPVASQSSGADSESGGGS